MLHVEIDGEWEAKDFVAFYESVHTLYSAFAIVWMEQESSEELERYYEDYLPFYPPGRSRSFSRRLPFFLRAQRDLAGPLVPPSKFRDAGDLLQPHERLFVRRCNYASPGATDLTGIGQVLGHVKDVIFKCIDLYTGRAERAIKNEILKEDRDAKALQNVATRVSILKSLGYTDAHCRQVVAEVSPAVAKLESLAQRGLLVHVETVENDDNDG
jgi:hypothetical protein